MTDGNKGRAITIDQPPQTRRVNIIVTGKKKAEGIFRIVVAPKNPPIIGKKPFCDGQELEWVVVDDLEPDQMLRIRDETFACFSNVPVDIHYPNNGALSGPPDDDTTPGTYWTYVVELFDGEGNLIASSDPGAIIHP